MRDAPPSTPTDRRLQLWIDAMLLVAAATALVLRGPAPASPGWWPGVDDVLAAMVLLAGGHLGLGLWRARRRPRR